MKNCTALAKVSNCVTRGNDSRLMKSRSKYDLRKYSFTSRIVNIYGTACLTGLYLLTQLFKNRLEALGRIYDFKAQLEGTGSRSM